MTSVAAYGGRTAMLALAAAAPAALWAEPILLPSGLEADLHEVLDEPQPYSDETYLVLRYVAPNLAMYNPGVSQADMDWLCETRAPAAAAALDRPPDLVILELAERPTVRGAASPGTLRFISSYRLEGDLCVWEAY